MAEKEYIERETVMKIIDDYGCTHGGTLGSHSGAVDVVGSAIYKLPAADVAPVKHGHWVYNQNGHDWGLGAWECSLCHSVNNNLPIDKRFSPYVYAGSKYCPNCGAKMDGGENS